MNSRAFRILEPVALFVGFILFWGVLIWSGLRWVDDGAPQPFTQSNR